MAYEQLGNGDARRRENAGAPSNLITDGPETRGPVRRRRQIVVVGCDFGTHSTKVLYQRRGDRERIQLARIDSRGNAASNEYDEHYPEFATPSLVSVDGDRMTFGWEALNQKSGTLHRSLKIALLEGAAVAPGETAPEVLTAAYLAWVFHRTRRLVAESYPEAELRVHMPAPMNNLGTVENAVIEERFTRVTQAAWKLSLAADVNPQLFVGPVASLSRITHELDILLAEPTMDRASRMFDVFPESIAPIVALAMDPSMTMGIYLLVDTGAGTTEISVTHATEVGSRQVAACYRDCSMLVGGDRLKAVAESRGIDSVFDEVMKIAKRCEAEYHQAYLKVQQHHVAKRQWRSLTIVLTGGGTRHPTVQRIFDWDGPGRIISYLRRQQVDYEILDGPPVRIDTRSLGISEFDARFLVVATGLLVERVSWPVVFPPHDVEPIFGGNATRPYYSDWTR
jgi:hypothetical protein